MGRPLYLHHPYVIVFLAAGVVLATREALVRRYLGGERPTDDAHSFVVLWVATGVGTTTALLLPFTGVATMPAPALAFWLGIAVMLAGFLLRLAAIRWLGRLFSHRVAVRPDHRVVEAGPYRFVRHPSYTGAVVTYLGIGVACGNWLSIATAVAGAFVGFAYRIRVEEQFLRRELAGYETYAEKTPYRLVPFVW
jgi:protein-S-isoprenylcysteine O-methyltransferase Ste14